MDDTYYFHQTPAQLAKDLIQYIPLIESDRLYEPFKGEGAFFDAFPNNPKDWSEITQGRDYKAYTGEYDWVITNPPFKLTDDNGKAVNSVWFLINYYIDRAKKGIAFLCNDYCLGTLTPKRLKVINDKGWFISKIVVCNVKKWRGRYFFVILQKQQSSFYNYLLDTY